MNQSNSWEKFYQETPLVKIPWQAAQDDFLQNVIHSGKISPGTALDLGCGTGIKSIFLAQNNFQVTGVDISQTAINHAKTNAKKAKSSINFIAADATNLSFLDGQKFDLILDWANLHGILEEKREKYISEITNHLKPKGKFILRCFGRKSIAEPKFVEQLMGKIFIFTKSEIETLFGNHFKIIQSHTSQSPGKTPPGKFFHEFLMEKI